MNDVLAFLLAGSIIAILGILMRSIIVAQIGAIIFLFPIFIRILQVLSARL